MGAHLGAQLRVLRFFFVVDASFSLLRLRERNWIDARAIVPENYLFEKFEWHYCVAQLTEIIICTSYIGPPFQESYTMLTSPKKDETAVRTLSVQMLCKLAVLSLAVLCRFKSFRFFENSVIFCLKTYSYLKILLCVTQSTDKIFIHNCVTETQSLQKTILSQILRDRIAWQYCVTEHSRPSLSIVHRPSSIVHRPSSIVHRLSSSVQVLVPADFLASI